MAKVFPDGWRELEATGAAGRELQTLGQLAAGLDDDYTVYHGVHWTRVERNNYAIVGEIDFAIVGPTGKLLLIEQKTGLLTETASGLVKKYGNYDLLGNAIFTDGDMPIDSVHRFKGRAALCVVFTEIDFETLDDAAVRRLFVGMTRATMKLTMVVSEQSARVLLDRVSIAS